MRSRRCSGAGRYQILIAAHERRERGRKSLSPELPRIEIVHDLPDQEKRHAKGGTTLERIAEDASRAEPCLLVSPAPKAKKRNTDKDSQQYQCQDEEPGACLR